MLVAAAVCPHPPLLVPEVAAGAAEETAGLRAACHAAVDSLYEAAPDLVVVVGDAPATGPYPAGLLGTFAGFGVPREVVLGAAPDALTSDVLPLSLAVGAWLLESAPADPPCRGYGVSATASSTAAAAIGVQLAAQADRVALLVMGDGSARRTEKAPGALDPRAADFDAAVATALAAADCDTLLDVDPVLAADLLAVGRASWQVLAGAAWGVGWDAEVTYDEAPYGVGYLVATWRRTPA
ncbi:MAG TPA: class III extradiol dioxygenase subunit B-like domain-containing protein [Mycobacteriales bacterium]|nr:class III extradiol dioxygenase subunit B-like domain-containing protein [Mycobacteriales bacterium]